MVDSRLPPLRLNSPTSIDSSRSNGSVTTNQKARERRRRKNSVSQPADTVNTETLDNSRNSRPRHDSASRRSAHENLNDSVRRSSRSSHSTVQDRPPIAHTNDAYVHDENDAPVRDSVSRPRKPKNTRKKGSGAVSKKARRATSNPTILQGLEDDIIEDDDNSAEATEARTQENYSESEAIQNESFAQMTHKSMPTDKYYLESKRKFEVQNKQVYEKKEQTRKQAELDFELKQLQDDRKYEIKTPKIALQLHKIVRVVFLFIHGLNVGFQFWDVIVISFLYYGEQNLLTMFKNLALPIHCLSYFFIALCIIDIMDRVDFTRMTRMYFIKCISFQNTFWCIFLYLIAFVSALSMIKVDDQVYVYSYGVYGTIDNVTVTISQLVTDTQKTIWTSLAIVKAVFCMLAWLLFSIFSQHDMTYESLEKRDYSLLDDLAKDNQNQTTNNNNNTNNLNNNQTKPI